MAIYVQNNKVVLTDCTFAGDKLEVEVFDGKVTLHFVNTKFLYCTPEDVLAFARQLVFMLEPKEATCDNQSSGEDEMFKVGDKVTAWSFGNPIEIAEVRWNDGKYVKVGSICYTAKSGAKCGSGFGVGHISLHQPGDDIEVGKMQILSRILGNVWRARLLRAWRVSHTLDELVALERRIEDAMKETTPCDNQS